MKKQNQTENSNASSDKDVTVGKDVSNSVVVTGSGNVINVNKKEGTKSESSKRKPANASKSGNNKKRGKLDTSILIALIGLAGIIITAVLSSPLIKEIFFSTPVPSSTPTMYLMETSATTLVAVTGEMQTVPPAFTLTPELENTSTASPSPESKTDQMMAFLQASMLEGKAPLKVNFDARISHIQFADGSSVACGTTRLCAYTFTIQLESKWLDTIRNNDGVFSYTFGRKGQYNVAVYVCRGDTCDSDGVVINVR